MPQRNMVFAHRRVLAVAAAGAMAAALAAALAACAEVGKTGEAAAMADTPTTQQARAECWMKFEGDKKAPKDLDLRVKLVEKCVEQKLNAPAAQ